MKGILILAAACAILSGCSTSASRMAACESQGVSRDACYIADQNRQSAINAAAEKQALENANALYSNKTDQTHHHHKSTNGEGY